LSRKAVKPRADNRESTVLIISDKSHSSQIAVTSHWLRKTAGRAFSPWNFQQCLVRSRKILTWWQATQNVLWPVQAVWRSRSSEACATRRRRFKVNALVFCWIRNKGLAFWPKHRNTIRMCINASFVTTEQNKTFSEIRKEEITCDRGCCICSVYFCYFEEEK
jgi:hypothetical protein